MGEIRSDNRECPVCLGALPAAPAVGRPAKYCSTACRRSAELEVRRVNDRLADLEARESHIRLHGEMSCYAKGQGAKRSVELIGQEVALQRARLLTLLAE